MRIGRIAGLLLVGLSLPLLAEAQSLGSVAKKERERRDKNKKEGVAAKEFKEEEVFGEKSKAKDDETLAEGEAGGKSEEKDGPSQDATIPGVSSKVEDDGEKFEKESRERRRSEVEWRTKASEARARIAAAKERVRFCEELYLGPNEYYVDAKGNTVVDSAEQLQSMTRQAKQELAAAEQNWKQIQDEARKSGVPPGWLR